MSQPSPGRPGTSETANEDDYSLAFAAGALLFTIVVLAASVGAVWALRIL